MGFTLLSPHLPKVPGVYCVHGKETGVLRGCPVAGADGCRGAGRTHFKSSQTGVPKASAIFCKISSPASFWPSSRRAKWAYSIPAWSASILCDHPFLSLNSAILRPTRAQMDDAVMCDGDFTIPQAWRYACLSRCPMGQLRMLSCRVAYVSFQPSGARREPIF